MVDLKYGSLNTCNITTWLKYSWKATNYEILKLWGEKWQNKKHKTKTGKRDDNVIYEHKSTG